ncbi:hypothetical protein AV540_25320 [Brevibacillus parabrevis]|uniref:hypothetical protein n=1 Tax=Brevibacillus parabrevis TaxID=54914 RepID=UPI0007ABA082|nr:hypothetical protein [Brevibacillus parabrevis]KZE43347.1 hypothetical protein AV540_25320 [Brevibacillus parabrevis]
MSEQEKKRLQLQKAVDGAFFNTVGKNFGCYLPSPSEVAEISDRYEAIFISVYTCPLPTFLLQHVLKEEVKAMAVKKSSPIKRKLKHKPKRIRARVIRLERFSLSGDVGGTKSFQIAPQQRRDIQVITVGIISSAFLVLNAARFNFQNRNIRLRVQVRGAKAFFQSTSNKQDFPGPNKVLFVESAEARAVELVISTVNVGSSAAFLHPQDGWWLDFLINKQG